MSKGIGKQNIFIAGHNGLVGSSILRLLKNKKKYNLLTVNRKKLNLLKQSDVENFFKSNKIDQVYLAAGRVGGIIANNTYPAEFIYENLMIITNIINSSFKNNVKKLLFFGSSCVYPKYSSQPINENSLMTGLLEPTNEPYAIAKIAGIKLCESYNRQYGLSHGIDYRCVMPTNLYGPNDNYHFENSHVIPALIRKLHNAKKINSKNVILWGTGKPKREFLFVDDLTRASYMIMNISKKKYKNALKKNCNHINIGASYDISIKKLSQTIAKIIGYKGNVIFDTKKPDGTPRKLINSNAISKLGWKPRISLDKGIKLTYEDYCKSIKN